jgi:hypothetical protein
MPQPWLAYARVAEWGRRRLQPCLSDAMLLLSTALVIAFVYSMGAVSGPLQLPGDGLAQAVAANPLCLPFHLPY